MLESDLLVLQHVLILGESDPVYGFRRDGDDT